jgi:hypothetical protein
VSGHVNPLASWSAYFQAQGGAAAALTGLLFVALSFNLERIAADRTWLSRAGTGLIYLAQPVIMSLVALFPTRTGGPVGWTPASGSPSRFPRPWYPAPAPACRPASKTSPPQSQQPPLRLRICRPWCSTNPQVSKGTDCLRPIMLVVSGQDIT